MTVPTLFRSRLSLPVPDGWLPAEMVRLTGPGGQSTISIEACPVAAGADLRPLADAHMAAMVGAADNVTTTGVVETSGFNGRCVLVGRASAPTGDHSMTLRTAYCIEGPWAYVAMGTAIVTDGQVDRAGDELEATLLALHLPAAPIARLASDGDGDGDRPGAAQRRSVVPARDWASARLAWQSPTPPSGDERSPVTFTAEQVAAAAFAGGASSAAGVDIRTLDSLAPVVRQAVLATATRSLVAGGVLSHGNGDARLRLLDPDGPLGLAVAHDLLVSVERSEPSATTTRCTFAARTDLAVEVAPVGRDATDTGMVELTTFPTAALIERLKIAVGLEPASASTPHDGLDIEISDRDLRAAIAGARDDAADTDASASPVLRSLLAAVTVRIVARHGGGVVGSELRLLDAGAEGWLLAEPASPSGGWGRVRLRRRTCAEMVDTFLAHLPGDDEPTRSTS